MVPEGILMACSTDCHIIQGDGTIIVDDFEEDYFEDYTF